MDFDDKRAGEFFRVLARGGEWRLSCRAPAPRGKAPALPRGDGKHFPRAGLNKIDVRGAGEFYRFAADKATGFFQARLATA